MQRIYQDIHVRKRTRIDFFKQRTIRWDEDTDSIKMIDQTLLPTRFHEIRCRNVEELIQSIKLMRVRGAPALGVAGAMGVAMSAILSGATSKKELIHSIRKDCESIRAARPTAVNLAWGVEKSLDYILKKFPPKFDKSLIRSQMIEFVRSLADLDVINNMALSDIGQNLIRDGDVVLTHCK